MFAVNIITVFITSLNILMLILYRKMFNLNEWILIALTTILVGTVAWGIVLKYIEDIKTLKRRFSLFTGYSLMLSSLYMFIMFYNNLFIAGKTHNEALLVIVILIYIVIVISSMRYRYKLYKGDFYREPGIPPQVYIPAIIMLALILLGSFSESNETITYDFNFFSPFIFLFMSYLFSTGSFLIMEYLVLFKDNRGTGRTTKRVRK